MPQVLTRQPRWLKDSSTPAYEFFQPKDTNGSRPPETPHRGSLRKIANRGSELFVAVGNELRWSDLAMLKEAGEGASSRYGRQEELDKQPAYKLLKTPTARPIRHISVSLSGDFIAILTSHTCHVCVLPPREYLQFQDKQPMKLRSFQVGPTAHVLERSPIASAIWHPLSPSGNGLVTVTEDASVRLWELDQNNRATFNEPALAVDLKKLANASTIREDFSASKYGFNKGFSPDDVEMQVAASCFGGQGREDEDGWSSMTLWIAMTEGDVYALCPFLPSKFWPPSTLLPSLSTSVVAKRRIIEQDQQASDFQRTVAHQQTKWLAELDQQEPILAAGTSDREVYSRPDQLSAVPRLQGPFQLSPELDFGGITDMHVIAPKINDESLFDDEEDFDFAESNDGLSIGIVCLVTDTSKIHICLNVEGVEAEWLPKRRATTSWMEDVSAVKDLLLIEMIDLESKDGEHRQETWPTFTASLVDRYEVIATLPTGVWNFSLRPWIGALESELSASEDITEGIAFRLNVMMESAPSKLTKITHGFDRNENSANAAIAVLDPLDIDVGYTIVTTTQTKPHVVILDTVSAAAHPFASDSDAPVGLIEAAESRAAYQPAKGFFDDSSLPAFLESWRQESVVKMRGDLKGQISFTSDTLQKITEAHRILSHETHNLGVAAADLFRHCERMLSEMQDQVEKARDLANRVNSVTGDDEFPDQPADGTELVRGGRRRVQNRIQAQKDKTEQLKDRVENLRKKIRGLGGKEMSAKERAFAEEVAKLEQNIFIPDPSASTGPTGILRMESSGFTVSTESQDTAAEDDDTIAGRVRAVNDVCSELLDQAAAVQKELAEKSAEDQSRPTTTGSQAQYGEYRQQKLAQVFAMLERETALVDAVSDRLEKLQMASQ